MCSIYECKISSQTRHGYYQLPTEPSVLRDAWVKNICMGMQKDPHNPPAWIFHEQMQLCSAHFKEDTRRLSQDDIVKQNIVPSIFKRKKFTNPLKPTKKSKEKPKKSKSKEALLYESMPEFSAEALLPKPSEVFDSDDSLSEFPNQRDVAVQVEVQVGPVNMAQKLEKARKALRQEKFRNKSLSAKLERLQQQTPEERRGKKKTQSGAGSSTEQDYHGTTRPDLHAKLDTIVLAAEAGDENAKFVLEQMELFQLGNLLDAFF